MFQVQVWRVVALLMTALVVVDGMHTHHTNYDKDAYLQSMEATKLRVQTDWNNIRQRIDRLKRDINNAGVQDKLRLTQEALADQRDILSRIEQYIGLPFPLKSCQCINFSQDDRTNLLEKMKTIKRQLAQLKKDVSNCPSCDRTLQLGNQVHRQEQYVQSMWKAVESECGRFSGGVPTLNQSTSGIVDLNKSTLVTNTAAPNWVYGNTTEQQYNLEKFAIASKNNITKCPLEKPFAKSAVECVDCTGSDNLWDLGRLQCTSCQPGYVYDAGIRSCVEKPNVPGPIGAVQFLTNLNAGNILAASRPFKDYEDEQSNLKRNAQSWKVCPATNPYLGKNGQCTNCGQDKSLFNMDTRQCTKCPEGTSYIPSLRNCTMNLYMTNPDAPGIIETDRMSLQQVTEEAARRLDVNPSNRMVPCSLDYPYFDGQRCISCSYPSPLFNLESQRCQSCPNSLSYNYKIKRCGQYQYLTSPSAPNLFLQGEKLSAYKELHDNKIANGQYLDCPTDAPYFQGFQCIKCTGAKPIFDLLRKRCMSCPSSTYFDVGRNTCVSKDVSVPATIERALMNIK